MYRILRPGGIFLIVNEVDGENPRDSRWLSVIDGMKIFNRSQFVTFLTEAGFSKVIVKRDAKDTGSVCWRSGRMRGVQAINNKRDPL